MGGPPIAAVAAVVAFAAPRPVEAVEPPAQTLRYDLKTGDRLVYRETLTRERESRVFHSVVEGEWTNEVLVLGVGRNPGRGHAYRGTPVEDCAMLQRSWHETRDPFRAHSIEIPLDVDR